MPIVGISLAVLMAYLSSKRPAGASLVVAAMMLGIALLVASNKPSMDQHFVASYWIIGLLFDSAIGIVCGQVIRLFKRSAPSKA